MVGEGYYLIALFPTALSADKHRETRAICRCSIACTVGPRGANCKKHSHLGTSIIWANQLDSLHFWVKERSLVYDIITFPVFVLCSILLKIYSNVLVIISLSSSVNKYYFKVCCGFYLYSMGFISYMMWIQYIWFDSGIGWIEATCDLFSNLSFGVMLWTMNHADHLLDTSVSSLSRDDKLLIKRFGPHQPKDFVLCVKDGKQNRLFKSEWYARFPWLTVSTERKCLLCFHCLLFACNW